MILFFQSQDGSLFGVGVKSKPSTSDIEKLKWCFNDASYLDVEVIDGNFVGPRKEMITPWSTNAVEITQNMGIVGIERIETFTPVGENGTPCYNLSIKD